MGTMAVQKAEELKDSRDAQSPLKTYCKVHRLRNCKSSKETPVREIMTSEVIHTSPDTKVRKCLSLMTKHHFRHIPVLEGEQLVGILSVEDVKGVT